MRDPPSVVARKKTGDISAHNFVPSKKRDKHSDYTNKNALLVKQSYSKQNNSIAKEYIAQTLDLHWENGYNNLYDIDGLSIFVHPEHTSIYTDNG